MSADSAGNFRHIHRWQGQEFSGESIGDRRWIHVPFSEPEPHGEGWAADRSLRMSSKLALPSEFTHVHVLVTSAWLDDVEVWVERLQPRSHQPPSRERLRRNAGAYTPELQIFGRVEVPAGAEMCKIAPDGERVLIARMDNFKQWKMVL